MACFHVLRLNAREADPIGPKISTPAQRRQKEAGENDVCPSSEEDPDDPIDPRLPQRFPCCTVQIWYARQWFTWRRDTPFPINLFRMVT
jgi:hypothetical protein